MATISSFLNIDFKRLLKQGDLVLAAGVVLILFVMVIPVPPFFLDMMLTLSISFSLVVLTTTMFMESPLEFSVFPTVVMVATLLRLGLNVATTRRILLHGDQGIDAAGSVIEAFGAFVVGGNFVIGIIVFLILFALNKMVIANGMQRIGEVTARFVLDAMPGKQMAIDADLNAGLINENQAKQKRDEVQREADFYGAMDGAGKFVEGDVNAGILITAINIVGGFFIGVFQQGMGWLEAAQTYTILTVGDGLVSIIPSLIVSSSAGLIVSRAAGEAKLSDEFLGQLTYHPRALRLVAGVLIIFGIIPGMPTIAFILLAAVLGGISYFAVVPSSKEKAAEKEEEKEQPAEETPEDVRSLLPLDPLALEVGYGLIPLVDEEQDGDLLSRIRSIRRQLAMEMGVVIPSMHVRDNLNLKPGQYSVLIKGNKVAGAEIMTDHLLAMDPGGAQKKIEEGVETKEPAFNLPAMWIPQARKEEAMMAGYTVVDPSTVIATHLTEVFKRNLQEFLGRQETQDLLDNLSQRAPKAVEELVPNIVPLGTLQKVLQNLVSEGVSIRDLLTIVETLADFGQYIGDPEQLTEFVRQKLSRNIVQPYLSSENTLMVINLSPQIEQKIQNNLRQSESGTYLAMEPAQAQKIIQAINSTYENIQVSDGQPVLLTSPQIRTHLSQLVVRFIPLLPVISQAEIPPDIRLDSISTVRLGNEG